MGLKLNQCFCIKIDEHTVLSDMCMCKGTHTQHTHIVSHMVNEPLLLSCPLALTHSAFKNFGPTE